MLYWYTALCAMLTGAVLAETVLLYPNIFADVPASLESAAQFMRVTGPADVFPVAGMLVLISGLVAIARYWSFRRVRTRLMASLLILVILEALLSIFFFWPRNQLLFTEGPRLHDAAFLRRIAAEFQLGHWLRIAGSAIGTILSFAALHSFTKKDKQWTAVS